MLGPTEFNAFLKEFWTDTRKQKTRYEDHPFFAMVPKNTEAGGEHCVIPIDTDDGAEGSSTFSDAQAIAAATSSVSNQFIFNWIESFQLAQVRNSVIRQSRKTPELALHKAAQETERAQKVLSRKLARALYRTGHGEKGTVGASTSLTTQTIVLSNAADARFFKKGDRLVFSESVSGHVLRDSGDYVSVVSVDVDSGSILTDAGTNLQTAINGIAAGDTIFAKGDRQNSATPTRLLMPGLAAWIPDATPGGSDSFGTVNRSTFTNRLAGLRYPASGNAGGPVEETFMRALAHGGNHEAKFSHLFCAPNVYVELLVALQGRKGYGEVSETVGKVGFSGFSFATGYTPQPIKIFSDGDCPPSRGYAVKLDTWELQSLGETIQNDLLSNGKDGEQGRDLDAASGMEWRYVFHGHLACKDPGQNMVVKFSL